METIENFHNIGDIMIKVYQSTDDNYSFYIKASDENLLNVVDILEDTLKQF